MYSANVLSAFIGVFSVVLSLAVSDVDAAVRVVPVSFQTASLPGHGAGGALVAPQFVETTAPSVRMSEDGLPMPFTLELHAEDANQDTIYWRIATEARFGVASAQGQGQTQAVGYLPNADFNGQDSFVVEVYDGISGSDFLTVNVEVEAVNDPPSIRGVMSTAVYQDTPYLFTPIGSDVDAGTTLQYHILNQPTWADFDSATGTLSGTPSNADVGITYQVTISVSDGELSSSLVPFDLTVVDVNDRPSISGTPDTTVNQDSGYRFAPLGSDIDAGAVLNYSIVNKPAWAGFDVNTGVLVGTPGNDDVGTTAGIVISVSDGDLSASLPSFDLTVVNLNDRPSIAGTPPTQVLQGESYDFTPTASDIDSGSVLTFSITNRPSWAQFDSTSGRLFGTPGNSDVGMTGNIVIRVSDGSLSASLPGFDLSVINVNDAPTISGTPETAVVQDMAYRFVPLGSDVDVGTHLVYRIVNPPAWAAFDPATGALTGTPGNDAVGITRDIVISVSDGILSAALAPFDLSVSNTNDAPVIAGEPTTTVKQDAHYTFAPLANDIDVGTVLHFEILNKPGWARFDSTSGMLTGTPGNHDVGVTRHVVISVNDGELSASLPPFDLTVEDINDAPVINGVPAVSVDEDSDYYFAPVASDPDVDAQLTFHISHLPPWAVFDATSGVLQGTPGNDDVGVTDDIVISVSDGLLTAQLPGFSLTVNNVNDAPSIAGTPNTSVEQGATYLFQPQASDVDFGDTLSFAIANKPTWAQFDPGSGQLSGRPGNWDVGTTHGIRISVSDGFLSSALPPFDLTVLNVNDPPIIQGTPPPSVVQDADYRFAPVVIDPDEGDSLTLSIDNKPLWANFDRQSGVLSGRPGNEDVGIYRNIRISVSDAQASDSLPPFDLTVVNRNDPPTISGIPTTLVSQGHEYVFEPTAGDIDANSVLHFSIDNRPPWADFDPNTGRLSGVPGNDDVGIYQHIVIAVSDGELSAALPEFAIAVDNQNDPPQLSGTPLLAVKQGEHYRFAPIAEDPDADTRLVFSIDNQPGWAGFDSTSGVLQGTPGNDDVGTTRHIVVRVSDGEFTAALPPFDLTVENVNDVPVIAGIPATSVLQDQAYRFAPEAGDIDPGDTLSFSIVNRPAWASFDSRQGILSGTPGNADVGTTKGIVIAVSDSLSSAALPAFDLTVVNVNDPPQISGVPVSEVNQGERYSFTPGAGDIDLADVLIFSVLNKPRWASFDSRTGQLQGTPGNADVGIYRAIVLSVSDGKQQASLPPFDLTVVDVNDPPSISGTAPTSVIQDHSYVFVPQANDVDSGDVLQFFIRNRPTWAAFDTATGKLYGTPSSEDVGIAKNVVIGVNDGQLSATLPPFDVQVVDSNDPPRISGQPPVQVVEDSPYLFEPVAVDSDVGDTLVFKISHQPTWTAFDSASGRLSGTPQNDDVGVFQDIVIAVTDGLSESALPPFDVTVINSNDPPVISGVPPTTVRENDFYQFVPQAVDVDVGDELNFAINTRPGWAEFDSKTGRLSGRPSREDVGVTQNIVITVSDGKVASALPPFELQVLLVNEPPTLSAESLSLDEDGSIDFTVTAQDSDDDPLTVEVTQPPAHGEVVFDGLSGTYTPYPDYYGTDQMILAASDGYAQSEAVTVDIEVRPVDDPNIVVNDVVYVQADSENKVYRLDVLANDNPDKALSLVGVFSLFGESWVDDDHLVLDADGVELSSMSLGYVAKKGDRYIEAQADVIFVGSKQLLTTERHPDDSKTTDIDSPTFVSTQIPVGPAGNLSAPTEAEPWPYSNSDIPTADLPHSGSSELALSAEAPVDSGTIAAYQDGLRKRIFGLDGGQVEARLAEDAGPEDNAALWTLNGQGSTAEVQGKRFSFDPSTYRPGVYRLGRAEPSTPSRALYIFLISGVREQGDRDGDGVPDMLDDSADCRVLLARPGILHSPVAGAWSNGCVSLGGVLSNLLPGSEGGDHGSELVALAQSAAIWPIDLVISGAESDARVVVALSQPLPVDATLLDLTPDSLFIDFVEDRHNRLFSGSPGSMGCAGFDTVWLPGLVPGSSCLKLIAEDGGANDFDRLSNGAVHVLGGILAPVSH